MSAAALLLVTALVAWPAFVRPQAAPPAVATTFAPPWDAAERTTPNFWGPPLQAAQQESYLDSVGGTRLVQYFDKARMEQAANNTVTNGLLTVELISGRRQFGDTTFTQFPPSNQIVVGDPTGTWPPYSALNSGVFPAIAPQQNTPVGTVYQPDGTFTTNSALAADPGAAFGSYERDPGGRYAHNVPLAFSAYLAKLPVAWQTAMGFPLTEAFWVNVPVNARFVWVLVQPFERRVLSYTPTNPQGFQVEMGNIGQHSFQWRYVTDPGGPEGPPTPTAVACVTAAPTLPPTATRTGATTTRTTATTTSTPTFSAVPTCVPPPPPPVCAIGTATPTTAPTATIPGTPFATAIFPPTATACVTATPDTTATALAKPGIEIQNMRASVTATTFTVSFTTNADAISYIRYGTTGYGSYTNAADIAATPTRSHSGTITGLQPGQLYYFAIRVESSSLGTTLREDYFYTDYAPYATDTPVPPTATASATLIIPSRTPSQPTAAATATGPVPTRGCPPPASVASATLTAVAGQSPATQTAFAATATAAAICQKK